MPPPHISPVDFIAIFSRRKCLKKKVLARKLFEIKFSTKYTHESLAYAYSFA